ncbi:MAG: hypothetical protein WBA89_05870 [Microcoleus sp.]|uniref:hypothetical protein n=1 Tax=Microcoleus sp. TaxID=44472 RepID=UPI003C734C82
MIPRIEYVAGTTFEIIGREAYPVTAIGLAIARKGADRMGGAIGLESTLGNCTRFRVKLRKCES